MSLVITLNGAAVDIDVTGATRLADLLEKIAGECFEPNEILAELTINGEPLPIDRLASSENLPLAGMETLGLETIKEPIRQVVALLGKMADYLDGFSGGLEKVADQFRMGSAEEANKSLFQALDGLSAFVELLDSVRRVTASDLSELMFENESFSGREQKLLGVTKKMKNAQEDRDWITVADLLEYELAPLMKEWKKMIPDIEREVRKLSN